MVFLWKPSKNVDLTEVLEHLRHRSRAQRRDVFFFDNGDVNDGTGLSASAADHVEYLAPVLRSAKYDALNVGNHEWLGVIIWMELSSGWSYHLVITVYGI